MKSAGHFPTHTQAAGPFIPYHINNNTRQASRHPESLPHPELHHAYPQLSVFQQQHMFIRPRPTSLPARFPLPTTSLPPSDFQVRQSTGTWFPPYPSSSQAPEGYSPLEEPPQVYPDGDLIPAAGLQKPQQHNSLDLVSLLQSTSTLPSCQYENSDKTQFGPSMNPFIHFDPSNPLHNDGNKTNSAVTQTIVYSGDKRGTFGGVDVQNYKASGINGSQTSDSNANVIDNTGHIDVEGNTMFLRTDSNPDHHDVISVDDLTIENHIVTLEKPDLSVETHCCSKCHVIFNSVSDLALHLKNEHYEKHKRSYATQHQTTRLARTLPNLFRCDICGCDFFFDSDLLDHQRTVHIPFIQERLEESVNKAMEIVNKQTVDASVKETVRHGKAVENLRKGISKEKETVNNQESNTVEEAESGKVPVSLAGTSEVQTNNKSYQNSQRDVVTGMDTDHENTWLCSLCTDTSMVEAEFINHMKDKHGENPEISARETSNVDNQTRLWKCDTCGGEYFFESDLTDHQEKVHSHIDVVDDVGESMRDELIVKLTMERQKGSRLGRKYRRGRGRVWMPSDYVYYGTGTDLDRNLGSQRGWKQVSGTRGCGRGRGYLQTIVSRGSDMYIENNETARQQTARRGRGSNKGTNTGQSSSTRGRRGPRGRKAGGKGKGRRKYRGAKLSYNQQTVLEPYESNESDVEIIEEPKIVIEIEDQEGSPTKSDKLENKNEIPYGENDGGSSNQCIFFYCGLCAFNCQSNDVLDEHMESHSLNGEIFQENVNKSKELLGNKYVTVELEKLSLDSNLLGGKVVSEHKVMRHLGQAFDEVEIPNKEGEQIIDINTLLQDAGLGTSASSSSRISKRRSRMSEKDKLLLKKHKIKEASVVLNHPKHIYLNNSPDKTGEATYDWLKSFNDNSDESDIDWDLPASTPNELDDGYETDQDDNSDVILTHEKKKSQHNIVNISSSNHTAVKINASSSKKSSMTVTNTNTVTETDNDTDDENMEKRVLWSDKANIDKDVKNRIRTTGSCLSADEIVPVKLQKLKTSSENSFRTGSKGIPKHLPKKYGIQESRVCLRGSDRLESKTRKSNKSLLMKYGIKESKVCLTDLGKTEKESNVKLEREDSQIFNISETSWWDEKKVKDKIDFSKTPIVPLERIDLDDNVVIMSIVKHSRMKKATARRSVGENTNTKDSVISVRKRSSGISNEIVRKLRDNTEKNPHEIAQSGKKNGLGAKSQGKFSFGQSLGKKASPKKRNFDWGLSALVKKSTRLMDLASATKRKALQKALSLIKHEYTQKKIVIQKSKKILQNAKNIQNSSNDQQKTKMSQRKRIFEEKNRELLKTIRKKDFEIKLARLNVGDINNWKQKEIDTENKIKEQMLKILTPEKIKAKVIVDKLPSEAVSSAGKCMDSLVAVAREMAKKKITHEFSLDIELGQNESPDVEMSQNQNPDVAVSHDGSPHIEMSRKEDGNPQDIVQDNLDVNFERVVKHDNVARFDCISKTVAKEIGLELIENVCKTSENTELIENDYNTKLTEKTVKPESTELIENEYKT